MVLVSRLIGGNPGDTSYAVPVIRSSLLFATDAKLLVGSAIFSFDSMRILYEDMDCHISLEPLKELIGADNLTLISSRLPPFLNRLFICRCLEDTNFYHHKWLFRSGEAGYNICHPIFSHIICSYRKIRSR